MSFTITDWNDLVDEVNEVLQNPPVNTMCLPKDPLPYVEDPHLWSHTDILTMQQAIQTTCTAISFDAIPKVWSQTRIDEIRASLDEMWCDCIYIPPCCDVSYQPQTSPVHLPLAGVGHGWKAHRIFSNGVCSEFVSNHEIKRWWINAYDELYQFQLYPNEDYAHARAWALKLEYDAWTIPWLCINNTLPAASFTVSSNQVLQNGKIHAYPTGWIAVSSAIVELRNRAGHGIDYWAVRPYTYKLYGYCVPLEAWDDDCGRGG